MKVYLRPGVTDMRKSINGLSSIVVNEMRLDPMTGYLFLFCNRKRDRIKILFWDRNGFWLWLKRLEQGKFPWPHSEEDVMAISEKEFDWLLAGIDFFRRHREIKFSHAG
jgi:transposase